MINDSLVQVIDSLANNKKVDSKYNQNTNLLSETKEIKYLNKKETAIITTNGNISFMIEGIFNNVKYT